MTANKKTPGGVFMEKEMYEAVIELQYKAIDNLMEANKKLMGFISSDHSHQ